MTVLYYLGKNQGPISYRVNGREYLGASNGPLRSLNVPEEDVEALLRTNRFSRTPPAGQEDLLDIGNITTHHDLPTSNQARNNTSRSLKR
jgi:hypothetical protein